MKKMISMISVAMLAVVFATGCGKMEKCDEAKTKTDCTKEGAFKEGVKCKWEPTAGKTGDSEGKCVEAKAADGDKDKDAAADKKACEDAVASEKACNDATKTLKDKANKGCKWTAGTPNKCEVADGKTLVGHEASVKADEAKCKAETNNTKCGDHDAGLVNKTTHKCVENTGTDAATVKCVLKAN